MSFLIFGNREWSHQTLTYRSLGVITYFHFLCINTWKWDHLAMRQETVKLFLQIVRDTFFAFQPAKRRARLLYYTLSVAVILGWVFLFFPFKNGSDSNKHAAASDCGFRLHLLEAQWCWKSFSLLIFLLRIFSGEVYLFESFALFKTLFEVCESLYYWDRRPLSGMCLPNIFFSLWLLSLILIKQPFKEKN